MVCWLLWRKALTTKSLSCFSSRMLVTLLLCAVTGRWLLTACWLAGVYERMLTRTDFSVSFVHTLNEAKRALTAARFVDECKDPASEISQAMSNGDIRLHPCSHSRNNMLFCAVISKTKMRLKQKLRASYDRLSARDKEKLGGKDKSVDSTAGKAMDQSLCCLPLLWVSLCMGVRDINREMRDEALSKSNGATLLHHILSKSCSPHPFHT